MTGGTIKEEFRACLLIRFHPCDGSDGLAESVLIQLLRSVLLLEMELSLPGLFLIVSRFDVANLRPE